MTHQLRPDIPARVEARIAAGAYADPDAVLRDDLDGLERRRQSLEHLRAMVREAEEDIAAGRVGCFDAHRTVDRIAAQAN